MKVHPAIKAQEEVKLISNDLQQQLSAYQQFFIGIKDIKSITTKQTEDKDNILDYLGETVTGLMPT